jgi:hypothetical protein
MPDTTAQSSRRKGVRVEIPRELCHAIVKIQAEKDLDFYEAALKAASLIDPNSQLFKQAVHNEALSLGKSQFLKQLNTARQVIKMQGFREGQEHVRSSEENFRVPCSICGKPMYFSSLDSNWKDAREYLYAAFRNSSHARCKEKQNA